MVVQGVSTYIRLIYVVCVHQCRNNTYLFKLLLRWPRIYVYIVTKTIKTINSRIKREAYTSPHMRNSMCYKTNDAMQLNHMQYNTSKHTARIASVNPT